MQKKEISVLSHEHIRQTSVSGTGKCGRGENKLFTSIILARLKFRDVSQNIPLPDIYLHKKELSAWSV